MIRCSVLTGALLLPSSVTSTTYVCLHSHEQVVRVFHGVPTDWCFAVGAFGGRVRVMRAGQTVDNQRPRAVVGDIVTFGVPDGDLGAGGSDVFVRFDVLDEDGDPVTAAGFPDGVFAVTETRHEAGSTCTAALLEDFQACHTCHPTPSPDFSLWLSSRRLLRPALFTGSFPDEIPIALPPGFTSGILMVRDGCSLTTAILAPRDLPQKCHVVRPPSVQVTVFDEDNDDDDVLYG